MEIIGEMLFAIFFTGIIILAITIIISLIILNLREIKEKIKKWKKEN